MRYNVFSLIKNSFSGHKNWQPAWRQPEPQKEYDIIIVGGGGRFLLVANRHLPYERGLAAAFARVEVLADAEGYKVIEAVRAT